MVHLQTFQFFIDFRGLKAKDKKQNKLTTYSAIRLAGRSTEMITCINEKRESMHNNPCPINGILLIMHLLHLIVLPFLMPMTKVVCSKLFGFEICEPNK